MKKPLNKANGLIVLSKYYAGAKETEKTVAALHDAAKALKDAENNNEKLTAAMVLAKSFVAYDRVAAFDVYRQIVDTINKLPAPDKQKEKMYYISLMPIADELIKSFRLLAAQDESEAFAIAQDIKIAELRVSALSGVYSQSRVVTKKTNVMDGQRVGLAAERRLAGTRITRLMGTSAPASAGGSVN